MLNYAHVRYLHWLARWSARSWHKFSFETLHVPRAGAGAGNGVLKTLTFHLRRVLKMA